MMQKKMTCFVICIVISVTLTIPLHATDQTIFSDGFESGDTTAWAMTADGTISLTVNGSAAIDDRYGLEIGIHGPGDTETYVMDSSPKSEKNFNVHFRIDPNNCNIASGQSIRVLRSRNSSNQKIFEISITGTGVSGQFSMIGHVSDDTGSTHSTPPVLISGVSSVHTQWQASAPEGTNNGYFKLKKDDSFDHSILNLDNDSHGIDNVMAGAIDPDLTTASGSFYLDSFDFWRSIRSSHLPAANLLLLPDN